MKVVIKCKTIRPIWVSLFLFMPALQFLLGYPIKGARPTSVQQEIPSPPVHGSITREDLDRAIDLGTRAFIQDFVKPSYAAVSNGGYVDYKDSGGRTRRYGPKAYVAYQLYLLTHFLMYYQDFDIDPKSELFQNVRDWFLKEFNVQEGKWLWSHEGCLHAKGIIALANLGRSSLAEKAYEWALKSPFSLPYLPPSSLPVRDRMFSIMQSGNIIQTLGNARKSLTGKHSWEHGSPVPDVENSAKLLYGLLKAGFPPKDVRVTDLRRGIINRILSFDDHMIAADYVGLVWYVFLIHEFQLEPDIAYQKCLQLMEQSINGGWKSHFALVEVPAFRSLMVRALMTAGKRSAQLDASVNGYVKSQGVDGVWTLPRALNLWGLDKPPAEGIKIGTMDGANTYLLTLTLIHYRDMDLSGTSLGPVLSSSPMSRFVVSALKKESLGARAVERLCTSCHPSPDAHAYSREDWPGVIRKMEEYMFEKGLDVSQKDLALVLDYLLETSSSQSGSTQKPVSK